MSCRSSKYKFRISSAVYVTNSTTWYTKSLEFSSADTIFAQNALIKSGVTRPVLATFVEEIGRNTITKPKRSLKIQI